MFSIEIEGVVPSVNRYWRHTRSGHHYISKEGREFKERLQWMAAAKKARMLDGAVELRFTWYCRKKCRGGDLDNRLKVILDALEGIIYEDDKQVVRIVAQKVMNAGRDGAQVVVLRI